MKKSTKAACLSLFVFPGVGLLWLKHWARGLLFFIPALAAIIYLFVKIFHITYSIYQKFLHQVEEGYLVVDATNMSAVAEKLYQDISFALANEHNVLNAIQIIFIACWICSAFSSYFVGLQIEKDAALSANTKE